MTIKPRKPFVIANLIRLKRQHFKGAILAVEGTTDLRLFRNLTDNETCLIQSCDGKNNVLDVVKELEESDFEGVLGVIDADFWRILKISAPSQNIVLTDTHDIDSMLLFSPALNTVLAELIKTEKVKKLKVSILDGVTRCAFPIGLLRLINEKSDGVYQFDFKRMNYGTFLNIGDFLTDLDLFLEHIKSISQETDFDKETIVREIKDLERQNLDPLQICRGKDLIGIMTHGLKNNFGNRRTNDLTSDLLNKDLRIAYNYEYFKNTNLRDEIINWEAVNSRYRILKNV